MLSIYIKVGRIYAVVKSKVELNITAKGFNMRNISLAGPRPITRSRAQ
jgi:hypothetical protein